MSYAKVWSKVVDSTIWFSSYPTRILWITMLASMNREYIVECTSIQALAAKAKITVEECRDAIAVLCAPDPESHIKTDEGRRVKMVDDGWFVINGYHYQEWAQVERRKQLNRERVARHRQLKKEAGETRNDTSVTPVTPVTPCNDAVTQCNDVTQNVMHDTITPHYLGRTRVSYPITISSISKSKNIISRNIKNATREKTAVAAFDLPDWIDSEIWGEFLKIRKQKKAINSIRAFKLLLTELEKLRSQGEDPNACMEQSIVNAWKDVYPKHPKEGNNRNGRKAKLSTEEFLRISRRSPDFGSGVVPHEKPVGD
jgi:hypothetical protein